MGITYISNRGGINTIPTPLRSGTIQGLRRKMLALNRKVRGFVVYMGQPQWVNSEWIVWYYVEQTLDDQLNEVSSGDN